MVHLLVFELATKNYYAMDLRKYNKQYAGGVESTVMDYTLNINRALKKKLKATYR
jgi:hypothetical protein